MHYADLGQIKIHYSDTGNPAGPAIVFANSLGTDLRLWDPILPLLPKSLRIIRYDKRGHGLSECPRPPYSMGALIQEIESLLDYLEIKKCVFVGLSIGGMIGQGLAYKRLDLIKGIVLSNTAAKIGQSSIWDERIEAVESNGIDALADAVMERWFSKKFRATKELNLWRNMLTRQPDYGYMGCCSAISETDFFTQTAELRLPAIGIAGSEDGSTPPDLVRETVDLIPGSTFHLIGGVGHLPCVESPDEYSKVITKFLTEIGHI